jgi:hypothetical protein
MAPEFFSYIVFVGLGVIVIIGLVVSVVLLVWSRYNIRLRKILRVLSIVSFSLVALLALMLFLLGSRLYQQDFLDQPLVSASINGDLVEVNQLLSRGASPDAYGVDYIQTALIAATRAGHPEVVALLLRSGAHPNLQDSFGETALEYAKEANSKEIISLLEQAEKAQ